MFKIDLARAEQELADLQSVTRQLLEAWEDADSAADRLHSTWAGDAATAHMAATDTWRDDVALMMTAMKEMHRALSTAHDNYASAADVNVQMWG